MRDPACLRAKAVLVVEDEALIAMNHADQLRALGCLVLGPVGTVQDALDLLRETAPDGVLLDGNLHGEMSAPVAEALRLRNVPFLVVTGYVQTLMPHPILREAPCVTKPFRSRELVLRMVETFC